MYVSTPTTSRKTSFDKRITLQLFQFVNLSNVSELIERLNSLII